MTYVQETLDIVQKNLTVIERNNDCEFITRESDNAHSVPRDAHFPLGVKLVAFLLTILKCSSQRLESVQHKAYQQEKMERSVSKAATWLLKPYCVLEQAVVFTLGISSDKVAVSIRHGKKVCGGNGFVGQWSVKEVDVGRRLDLLILNVLIYP